MSDRKKTMSAAETAEIAGFVAEKSVEKKRPVKKTAEEIVKKPEVEAAVKPETKPETKVKPKTKVKPETKQETKQETKPETKQEKTTKVNAEPEKKSSIPKKKEVVEDVTVHIQFSGKSYTCKDLAKIAKNVWVYDLGKKAGDFKSLDLYVKPEENIAYYVINGSVKGRFFI